MRSRWKFFSQVGYMCVGGGKHVIDFWKIRIFTRKSAAVRYTWSCRRRVANIMSGEIHMEKEATQPNLHAQVIAHNIPQPSMGNYCTN